jgi:crotonobetainyl-CoA:carnitine CoA-transferase CaiB-like acyl-CoA transferase
MLSHLKVVEITDELGAYAGRLLAELGAEVIKIEQPGGDPGRRAALATGQDSTLDWQVANAGKRGAQIDLATSEGRAQAETLCAQADILIQGDRDRLAQVGLDYDRLSAANPGLISVVVSAFAEDSDRNAIPHTDLTLLAMSGVVNMVGPPDQPPLALPGQQAYALAGIQGVTAALTALYERASSKRGQRVVVSAYQAAVLAGYRDPLVWEWTGRIGQRTGNRLVRGKSGVRQVWQARDGYVTWSLVDNPPMVRGMVAMMQADGAAGSMANVDWDKVLLADAPQDQIDAWEAVLEAWFLTKDRDDLAAASAEKGLGLSRIETPAEALAAPHWMERGFWRRLHDPARGVDIPIPGPMFVSDQAGGADTIPAPSLASPGALQFSDKEPQ